jgi:hypothetical protein
MGFYYDKILEITSDYLGPASNRFLDRQIESHLKKLPQDLKQTDIQALAIRIRSGLLVLTQDEMVVDEAFKRIASVGDLAAEPVAE